MIEPDDFIFVSDWPSIACEDVLCGATEGVTELFEKAKAKTNKRVILPGRVGDLVVSRNPPAMAMRSDDMPAMRQDVPDKKGQT